MGGIGESCSEDILDSLERVVLEIEAMDAICNADTDIDDETKEKDFVVISQRALEQAQTFIDEANASDAPSQIDIEAVVRSEETNDEKTLLRFSLPTGYPTINGLTVTVLHTPKFVTRGDYDTLSAKLQRIADDLLGSEAMMSIISECRDIISDWGRNIIIDIPTTHSEDDDTSSLHISPVIICRRWIWVHHITNNDRRKQVIIEAKDRKLGGFLKAGYPGVIIVEGERGACDEFVIWIKGNKSRPGGFGRNWGHHVRGEATTEQRQLPEVFEELEDDMGLLGSCCRKYGVDDEFREFILQQK